MRVALLRVLAVVGLAQLAATAVQAQSVKTLFEKYNMLDTFAADCTKPVGAQNVYLVHRALGEQVQRDMLDGPTSVYQVHVIESATGLGPNEIKVVMKSHRGGSNVTLVYRAERDRLRVLDSITDAGRQLISGGRILSSNREAPWFNRCK